MNYADPELRDRLAAEYVLGTLNGRARARFERLLLTDPGLRDDIERWERHLGAMALALPQRRPRARVWRRIRRRIRPRPEARGPVGWLWPLGAGAGAAAAVLAVYLAVAPPQPRTLEPEFVATIGAEQKGPRWSVAADLDEDTLTVRALRKADIPPDKDLELWLLPSGDTAPISLGLLPAKGRRSQPIPPEAVAAAPDAAGIAISREPEGGSPTGAPTGPVLYQGSLVPL